MSHCVKKGEEIERLRELVELVGGYSVRMVARPTCGFHPGFPRLLTKSGGEGPFPKSSLEMLVRKGLLRKTGAHSFSVTKAGREALSA